MKLIYCYIRKFRNIENKEVLLSDEWRANFRYGVLTILKVKGDAVQEYLYGNGFMRDLRLVVGETGSGKTNFLQMIGINHYERARCSEQGDSYLMLYKLKKDDSFVVEVAGLPSSILLTKRMQTNTNFGH